jgi:regulator of cell morphogenesis and NO signaling
MNTQETPAQPAGQAAPIRPDQTLGDLVARDPGLKLPLEKMGLDYCCGGKRTLAQAAHEAGLDPQTVINRLEAARGPGTASPEVDWTARPVTELADHILDTHHVFTKAQLPRIDRLLTRVQQAHAARHGRLLSELRNLFDTLRSELENHLMKEEVILFPAIKSIDGYLSGGGEKPALHCGSIAIPILQMEHEHDGAGGVLAALRARTDGYRAPEDACETFKALYEAFEALEADLHQHIHLENNILFPASVKQEQQMRGEA